ncbi:MULTISPECIES: DUF4148 domain-containing protein [Pseudacidovorax]|uniref:DUF4148 domain-containing protein n=1 Tax=Pseudacidovorax TaxID=433923 RepID=UPI001B64456C|nr:MULTISPECIES: DUF4148 domain-containing protein [Pseudacidovorax]MBP6898238.1 DUF4148 domain-containing protein [Pseudacidovorax sp.]
MQAHFRHSLVAAAGAATLLLAPAAMAAGAYHPATTEAGATFHPEHASTKTREQVNADLQTAMKHPAWDRVSRGAPWPVAKTGPGLTREQVNADLQAAMKHPAWDRVSRGGAPWPVERLAATQSSSK